MKPFWKFNRRGSDPIVNVGDADDDMDLAIAQAKGSIAQFFDSFSSPTPSQASFLLKVRFDINGQVEHIWLADLVLSETTMSGTVANEPRIKGLKFLQSTEFAPAQVTDWMYIEDGYLVGGFTTKAIRARLSAKERASLDANAPYKFPS